MSKARLHPLDGTIGVGPVPDRRPPASPSPSRQKVVRRGALASVLAPLASVAAVLVLVAGLVSIGGNWWAAYQRDTVYGRAVQPDDSIAAIETGEPLVETVTLLVRDGDGELRRLVAERTDADRFVNDTLRRLDAARARIKGLAAAEVETIFTLVFADVDEAVERYADWFFAWSRSYVVLKEALVSTMTRVVQLGSFETLPTAVERDLQDYFKRHYSEQVLRPEHRDALIARAFEQAARRAHERWREVVAQEDLRLQLFLAQHTEHLEQAESAAPLTLVALDWDAQRFKSPAYLTEDKAFAGIVRLATLGTGGTIGALALRPAMERATTRLFAGLGRRYAAAFGGRLAMARTGAAVGSAVQPVSGTALGAVAGGLLALAADYAMNETSEVLDRGAFVAANREAVGLTMTLWQDRLTRALDTALDRWFDDTRAAVLLSG